MDVHSADSTGSLDDEDLADVRIDVRFHNNRYEHDDGPLTSRGLPAGFARPNFGFNLNLPAPLPDESESPRVPNGLQAMRSEPVYLPETSRPRQPPGLALPNAQGRGATSFTGVTEEAAASLLTRRGPLKPPMLSLANPASASPVPSGAPTPAMRAAAFDSPTCRHTVTAWPAPTTARGRASPVHVELLSSAFLVQQAPAPRSGPSRSEGGDLPDGDAEPPPPPLSSAHAAGSTAASSSSSSSLAGRIVAQCSGQLGIDPRELQFFELRPLDIAALPESCSHVGVRVRGSTFSLSAIEDMLARAKRDQQLTALLEGALRDSSQHAAEARRGADRLAQQSEELAVLRERLVAAEAAKQAAEAASQQLREQLQRSDEQRQLLGATIRTIKREFEDFKSRVVVEGSVEQLLPMQQLSLGGGPHGGPPPPPPPAATAAAPAATAATSPGTAAAAATAAAVAGGGGSQIPVMAAAGATGPTGLSAGGGGGRGGSGGGTSRGDPLPLRR